MKFVSYQIPFPQGWDEEEEAERRRRDDFERRPFFFWGGYGGSRGKGKGAINFSLLGIQYV